MAARALGTPQRPSHPCSSRARLALCGARPSQGARRYFNLLKRQGMLPAYGEQPPEWRRRVARWEAETGVPISSLAMVEREPGFPGLFPV